MIERENFVAFADESMKKAFEKLKEEDPKLHKFIAILENLLPHVEVVFD